MFKSKANGNGAPLGKVQVVVSGEVPFTSTSLSLTVTVYEKSLLLAAAVVASLISIAMDIWVLD